MIYHTLVSTVDELHQILELQQVNLKQNISKEEKETQGFITMPFTIPILEAMQELAPSVIIKDDNKVVAYALVLLREGRNIYPDFEPMFKNFETLTWKDVPLNNYQYYIIGQITVAKEYRGKGLVELLYKKHREEYKDRFDFVVTEISSQNYRSIRAHERIGFITISVHRDHIDEWAVVLWDWRKN